MSVPDVVPAGLHAAAGAAVGGAVDSSAVGGAVDSSAVGGAVDTAAAATAAVALQSVGEALPPVDAPRLVGFAIASFVVAAAGAAAYRWYVGEPVPEGLTTLLGTATVAVYLNTVGLFSTVIPVAGGPAATDPFAPATVLSNVVSLLVAAGASPVGRRAGDRFATNVTAVAGADRVEGELSRFAKRVGRIRAVDIPDEVADIDGYDPMDDATKERLAGETLLFPRRLTDGELRDRLVTRLKEEYGVGHVDAEFDGVELTHLGVARRMAGIGPTLGPGACAVAVRADPPHGAGPGDAVQVWRRVERTADPAPSAATGEPEADGGSDGEPSFERVAAAELRAVAGDVVTLAVDEADAGSFDADADYRLVTMPTSPRADREFASLLRVADETMAAVAVRAEGALAGTPVGDLAGTVVAVEAADGSVEPIPPRGRTLAVEETVYVVARPEVLRELERRAAGTPTDTDGGVDGDGEAVPDATR
ncbi:potassium transporter TrkA [Halobaculum lipolyticum]|uniref:Potassium transporter TrkA n=1 Tax=Halobaculum lipolyticum TaxID=3032001 RepID=A0ABD5W479_9EURY|nr:potassium transporter TrkA [Halobaculum sp. DT31]